MISYPVGIALFMLLALLAYCLSGGADFGGGVWDLFARGPRAPAQRKLVARAIAPIWEANHVWLIIVVVLLFVAFPKAFAAVSIALHIPLSLMLLGIVIRGSAFAFQSQRAADLGRPDRWTWLFAAASLLTPWMLGVTLGALSTGGIRVDPDSGRVFTGFVESWWRPFPMAVGFFTLSLFAFLAAVYLTLEASERSLREDFRKRALIAAGAVAIGAVLAYFLALEGAPRVQMGLGQAWWAWPLHILTALAAVAAILALFLRAYAWARIGAVTQVSLIVVGWGLAQFPYLVVPDLTLENSAAPDSVLRPLFFTLILGLVVIVPAFLYLYRVFKGKKAALFPPKT